MAKYTVMDRRSISHIYSDIMSHLLCIALVSIFGKSTMASVQNLLNAEALNYFGEEVKHGIQN